MAVDRHPPEEREQEAPRTVSPEDAAAAARQLQRWFGVLLEYWLQQQQKQQQQQAAGTAYSGDAPGVTAARRGQTGGNRASHQVGPGGRDNPFSQRLLF